MDQPAPVVGGEKYAFAGFFPVYLAAAVILIVYVIIDFQVRLSPVIREWALNSTTQDPASPKKSVSASPVPPTSSPVVSADPTPVVSSATGGVTTPVTGTSDHISGGVPETPSAAMVVPATATAAAAQGAYLVATDESTLSAPVSAPATTPEIILSNDISSCPVSATQTVQETPEYSTNTREVGK